MKPMRSPHENIKQSESQIMIENRFKKGLNTNLHGVHIEDDDVCHYQIQLHQQ